MSFVEELKRRNVFRVAIAYVIIAWLILQVGDTLAPALTPARVGQHGAGVFPDSWFSRGHFPCLGL